MTADPRVVELADALGSSREAAWVLEELDGLPAAERHARAVELIRRRRAGEPLQYLLGHWPFRTLDLLVDARALIPRPETELLVDVALAALGDAPDGAVACDLGCGTGAIALSLAIEGSQNGRELEVLATDVSSDALALAALNAERTGATRVRFSRGSWFDAIPTTHLGSIDLVCSNPPYVATLERHGLAVELDYEPELALVAPDGADGTPGLGAIEAIVVAAPRWLSSGGALVLEHGATQRRAVVACCEEAGLSDVRVLDDLAGLPRFVEARRPR